MTGWLLVAAAMSMGAERPASGWTDCLAPRGRTAWTPIRGGERRYVDGELEVRTELGAQWATVALARTKHSVYDLELELRWGGREKSSGGLEVAVGPHAFGSSGYRFVVRRESWQVAECRGPRLGPGKWHSVRLRACGNELEYWLGGRLIARSPVEGPRRGVVRLLVKPATEVVVRRCRLRGYGPGERSGPTAGGLRFVYPAADFPHDGRVLARAVELSGRGRGEWLVWGQDASLPLRGAYAAVFSLRGTEGSGSVWVEVARSGRGAIAARALRLEELPTRRPTRVALPFRYEAGWLLEFRLAAEQGRLTLADVTVVRAEDARRSVEERLPIRGDGRGARCRRALPLAEVWGKAARNEGAAPGGLRIVSLRRQLRAGGWYEFRAAWRQEMSVRMDDVAVDMWVACRDDWGRVKTFDFGAAYDAVGPGPHETAAWLDPARIRLGGSGGRQVYRRGGAGGRVA